MYDPKYKEAYLAHYNHNHDALGRFASGPATRAYSLEKAKRALRKDYKQYDKNLKKGLNAKELKNAGSKRSVDNRLDLFDQFRKNQYKKNTKLGKAYNDYLDLAYKVQIEVEKSIEKNIPFDDSKWETKLTKAWNNYKEEEFKQSKKYLDKYADATIKDLNLDNTKEVKDFIKSYAEKESVLDDYVPGIYVPKTKNSFLEYLDYLKAKDAYEAEQYVEWLKWY